MRELVRERLKLGLPFSFPGEQPPKFPAKEVIGYLDSISNPEQAADLVSCAVLAGASERQAILEAVDIETRLRRLIQFLLRDIRSHQKGRHE